MNNVSRVTSIIESIETSLKSENFFSTLTNSLILIDICSKIYLPNEKKNHKRYKAWIDQFLLIEVNSNNTESKYLSSSNIWFLRNAMLHQGSSNPTTNDQYQKNGKEKVLDIVPTLFLDGKPNNKKILVTDIGKEYPVLFFDVHYFCETVTKTASNWIKNNIELVSNADVQLFTIAIAIHEGNKIKIIR